MLVAHLVGALLLQAITPVSPAAPAPADTSPAVRSAVPDQKPHAPNAAAASDTPTAAPFDARLVPHWDMASSDTNPRRRPRAVEYSDWYYRRLVIHRWASYLELPIFGAEYYLGQRLIDGPYASWVRPAHGATAGALGALFAVNTVTGVWNLWEGRSSTDQRALVWTHSALMLASDLGFAITPALVNDDGGGANYARTHKRVAVASMGVATFATVIMWFGRH